MRTMRISIILAALLITVYCRPGKDKDNSEDYADDPPQDYDDDEAELDNEGNHPGPDPEIKTKPMFLEVRPGDNVELPCVVAYADDVAIAWKKDNESLYFGSVATTKDVDRIVRTSNNSLIIYNVTKADSSDHYSCEVLAGKILEVVHRLRVVNKPKELEDPRLIKVDPDKRVEVDENESVTFSCTPKSNAQIIWSHKGQRLHNGEEVDASGQSVTIKKASRHHSGTYQCLAQFSNDRLAHEAINISVRYAPVIEVEHEVVHGGTGVPSRLTCRVHAHPRAKVTWFKNQKSLGTKKDKKFTTSEEKALHSLNVLHVTQNDFGTYSCHATNAMGKSSKDIILSGIPMKPKFVGGEIDDDETTMKLKWAVESYAPVLEYRLDYRRKGDSEWNSVSPSVEDGKGNTFSVEYGLKNLQPEASYEVMLLARNEFGWSPNSAVHTFNKEYVSDEPQNVKGTTFHFSDATTSRPLAALVVAAILVLASHVSTYV